LIAAFMLRYIPFDGLCGCADWKFGDDRVYVVVVVLDERKQGGRGYCLPSRDAQVSEVPNLPSFLISHKSSEVGAHPFRDERTPEMLVFDLPNDAFCNVLRILGR
jgi:hypothetical protein